MDFLKISDKTTTTTTPCRTDSLSFGVRDMDFHHLIAPHAGNGVLGCYYYYPFTNEQLKELERQAMIYKYMIASIPVPFDLLVSSSPSPIKNVNGDLEPGRCRRTDGKKWRCSREVVSNHKYCERHLHRGRPRSRKLVEQPYSRNNGGSDKTTPKKVSSLPEARGNKIFSVPATTPEEDNKYLTFIDVWSDQLRGSEKQSSSSSPVSAVNGNLSLYSLDLSMGGNNYDEMSRIQMGENPVYSSYGTLGGPLAEILRPNPYLDFSGLQSMTEPLFTNAAGDRESCSLATTLTRSSSPSRVMKKRNGSVSDESSHV